MSDLGQSDDWEIRVQAAIPEAMDYLDEHPDRMERVARALVERVLAAADQAASRGQSE